MTSTVKPTTVETTLIPGVTQRSNAMEQATYSKSRPNGHPTSKVKDKTPLIATKVPEIYDNTNSQITTNPGTQH